jgi:stage II sporulation protein AA (anti-sigma F factor antagonist)
MPYGWAREGEGVTMRLTGELGHHEAIAVMAGVAEVLDAQLPRSLTLDMSGLSFMDSSGIAVVVQAARRCKNIGADFSVSAAPPTAMRILKAAGVDRIVQFT